MAAQRRKEAEAAKIEKARQLYDFVVFVAAV
jgi:hypothetical protein